MTILIADAPTEDRKADWLLVFEAALRVGDFSSFDELLLRALDAWLEQLPIDLRWEIAIELYRNDRISTGIEHLLVCAVERQVRIAFQERCGKEGIPTNPPYLWDGYNLGGF